MDVKELIALIGVLAGAFKAITSGLKDLQELKEKQKRRPRQRKRR
ncbi:hypothetical protein [Halalkalibacterium halodurans]|nr:hypothetical protein [Halalkalibacterium halodurans]MDY7224704.1 hypothetical protein [Halalkalibacterium halodurans]MDY7243219.1 hypothetical protein [Halalkalibacterium halodurans]